MDKQETFQDLGKYKGFKLVHCNVRSLVKKIDQIRLLVEGSNIDIFTISETWLKQHLSTLLVRIDGYQSFRQDRKSRLKPGKRGGGLITYVREAYASSCESIEELDMSNDYIEAQWLYLHREHCKDIVVCNAYRPPKGDVMKAITYLDDCMKTLNLQKVDLFLLGDLNINYKNKQSPDYKKLNFFAQSNGLAQHISSTTRNNDKTKSLLDLAISNSKFISHAGTLSHFIRDHQPIYIVHKKGRDLRQSVEFEGRSYRNFKIEGFKDILLSSDWRGYYDLNDPGEAWDFILSIIIKAVDAMCPVRSFRIKNYRPEWMSKELIEQVKDRDYFYEKAKSQGDEDAWNIAKHLRNTTNTNIRQAKREFILNELELRSDDPKKFWKTIRTVVPSNKNNQTHDILLKHAGNKVDKENVAQFINDYFVNVGNFEIPDSPAQGEEPDLVQEDGVNEQLNLFDSIRAVTELDVFNIVKDVNISKLSGLDNVSSYILKEAFKILIAEVTFMYNLSIRFSKFPDAWKQALVIPIPKVGNPSLVQNYRPISLLPLPGKILEKLVHKQLSNYLEMDELLVDEQHGFRKGHSTTHAVAQLSNYVSKKLDSRMATLVAYIDFRKAFDCVQHPLLINKLARLGAGGMVLDWVRSYLSNRTQRVYANNVYSPTQVITQGVPQGSVLGPLFYIIYANDISKIVKNCEIALYADDTVLFTANSNFGKSVNNLQDDLNSLNVWCKNNGILANTDKTKVMVFGTPNMLSKLPSYEVKLDDTLLQVVTAYKYLGITLDSQLKYNLHVNRLIGSVTAKLKQFQRMRSFLNTKAALMVYKNMLLPILEYGDIFLTAATNINKKRLQVIQNKGLRCALGRNIETSTSELHREARLLQLKYRREQHLLNFMYDQAQNTDMLRSRNASAVRTRTSNKKLLKVRRPRTESFRKSLAYVGPKKWNQLQEVFHHTQSKQTYKMLVNQMLWDKSIKARSGGNGLGEINDSLV